MEKIELTDEIRQPPEDDEHVGYLVFNSDKSVSEYEIFKRLDEAERYAELQCEKEIDIRKHNSDDELVGDWNVYPLWAGCSIAV